MPYTITSERGVSYTYPSEEAYEEAQDWYHSPTRDKEEFISFCRARGVEIETFGGRLVADWADIAMHTYATKR